MNEQASSTSSTAAVKPVKPPPFRLSAPTQTPSKLMALIYGAPGTGKSTLAGSYADTGSKVFYINCESGDMVFNDNPRIKHPENITAVDVNRFQTIVDIHSFLTSYIALRDAGNTAKLIEQESWLRGVQVTEPTMWDTIVIDTITELERYCMNHLLGIHDKFEGINIDPDMKTAEFSEYKKNNNIMNTIIRHFRDLPLNFIALAHERWSQDETQKFHYMPALTGQLRDQSQGYFDIVGRLVTGAPKEDKTIPRRLYVAPVGKWDAKCRRASFSGSHFEDPTMSSILEGLGMLNKS